jgi:hypothetical protein
MSERTFRIVIDMTVNNDEVGIAVAVTGDSPSTVEVVGALQMAIPTHLGSKFRRDESDE